MSESFVDRFEKELFTDEERELEDEVKWSKYYDKESETFLPPYTLEEIKTDPKTQLEKFHICHYAYWMVISFFTPFTKPDIQKGDAPDSNCYACEYAQNKKDLKDISKCEKCPIEWDECGSKSCNGSNESLYWLWFYALSEKEASAFAKEMAMIPWRE